MDIIPSITKSVRVFRFDPHPCRKQLAIVGEASITIVRCNKIVKEFSEPFKTGVKLIGLNHSSRTEAIVNDIIQSCPFVDLESAGLRASLREVIEELKGREYDGNGVAIMPRTASDGSSLPRYLEVFDEVESGNGGGARKGTSSKGQQPEADIRALNQYIEMLYENISSKTEGLRRISSLTKYNRYLVEVSQHASAANAIFRTLREDSGKSLDLTAHSLSICLDFAKFKCFHSFLKRHKLSVRILEIIDYEMDRCEKWKVQLQKREDVARTSQSAMALGDFATASENFHAHVELQNIILALGFNVLHYLSEERMVATSLLRQGIVTSLTDALERTDFSVLESAIGFLKDMSAYKEYVGQMIAVGTLPKFAKILKGKEKVPKNVAKLSIGLLCNLAFHGRLRTEMVNLGLLSVLANCLSKPFLSDVTAKTLYLISMDAHHRGKVAKSGATKNTNGIPEELLKQLVSELDAHDPDQIPRIKGALAVNVAKDPRGAKVMGECMHIASLLKHSIKTGDILGMKIIRNVVETGSSPIINQQAGHIARAINEARSMEFALECVGILAGLNPEEVAWPELLKKNRIVLWLKRQILNYTNMTNIATLTYQVKTAALDGVILLGNVCKSEAAAKFIVSQGLIDQTLIHLLPSAHTDPQIVQQIVYLFNVVCAHSSLAKFLATKSDFSRQLMGFAVSIGGPLRAQVDATLHILSAFDETLNDTFMEYEFLGYNEKWATAFTAQMRAEQQEDYHQRSAYASDPKFHVNIDYYRNRVKGGGGAAGDHYNSSGGSLEDDDEEDLGRAPSSCDVTFDDCSSTTDEESSFYVAKFRPMTGGGSGLEKKTGATHLNLYEMYLAQMEEEMEKSQDWKFFLK